MHADRIIAVPTKDADHLLERGTGHTKRVVSDAAVEKSAARDFHVATEDDCVVSGTGLDRDIAWCCVSPGRDHEQGRGSVDRRVTQASQDDLVIDNSEFDRIIDRIACHRQMRTAQTGQHVASQQSTGFQRLDALRCCGPWVLRSLFATTVSQIPHVSTLVSVSRSVAKAAARDATIGDGTVSLLSVELP